MNFPFDEEAREGLPLMIKAVLKAVKLQFGTPGSKLRIGEGMPLT
jgi:hypothetical protein